MIVNVRLYFGDGVEQYPIGRSYRVKSILRWMAGVPLTCVNASGVHMGEKAQRSARRKAATRSSRTRRHERHPCRQATSDSRASIAVARRDGAHPAFRGEMRRVVSAGEDPGFS